MKAKIIGGLALILLSLFLFVLDFSRMGAIILQLFAILNIVSPFLSGKKIAGYVHDFQIVRREGRRTSPMVLVYLWLFVWLVFLMLYIISTIMLSYAIKYIIASARADYMGIFYSLFMLIGTYLFFLGRHANSGMVTRWGRMVERTENLGKSHIERVKRRIPRF
ncbi:hypothetical protein AciM339_0893 [Aciduliprofundum sp. MAR08-339]|uniref:hypothetical protein n=1 Tax=Aciduliprofundum sp. (strain MAR08-339) TaxID=673860 RepID=UPI0002A48C68|nr:hypothetical protein AciM339_0893 [Aciduliprofundum sp. MAR08-339]